MRIRLRRVRLVTKKDHGRNKPALGVESQQTGVAVLMRNEEITLAIMQKLRVFTLTQRNIKMLLDNRLQPHQPINDQLNRNN